MRHTAIAAVILAAATLPAAGQGLAVDFRNTAKTETCARVYGFTGLFGQAGGYSLGVFAELDKIAKAYPCVRIYKRAWTEKARTWATIKANHELFGEPIFLIGHSKGADAALAIARWLANDGIPVATVFSYDPTRTQAGCVPENVLTFINWRGTRFGNLGQGNPQPCGGQTKTAMQDYPLPVKHVLIDDLPTVHAQTTKHVGEVLHMTREMAGKRSSFAPIGGQGTYGHLWPRSLSVQPYPPMPPMISAARRRGACEGLSPRGRALWRRIRAAFPDARCVSGYRPGARTPGGQQSYHATGDAIDWSTSRKAAGVAWSRKHAPGLTMTYPNMNHIHSDVGRWKAYAHGYGGRGAYASARRRR